MIVNDTSSSQLKATVVHEVDNVDKHICSDDVDIAYELAKRSHGIIIDERTNRKLLRKIDMHICPLLCLVYAIQFMDKISNAGASIMGMIEDLDMRGNDYNWVGTGFYLGYLVFEFPNVLALQRFPVAKAVSAFIIVWGVVMMFVAIPKTYAGYEALRTLLGALESAITPAFVIITGQWYRREEQFLRTTIWFSCNGLGTIIGCGIAYGLLQRQYTVGTPIEAWRLLYLIMGSMTIVFGALMFLFIPDSPARAWFLSEEEKLQVVERIRDNQQGFGNRHFKWKQFREVFTDVRTYVMFIYVIASNIPNGSITNFAAILITGMGFSISQTLLLNMPTGAVELVGCILFGLIARKFNTGLPVAIAGAVIFNLLAMCLLAFTKQPHAQLSGVWLFGASPVPYICLLSNLSSNVAGHTKKIVSNAIFLIGYCVGNMIGPQTFIGSQAPHYYGAKIAMVVCAAAQIVCLVVLLFYYRWENGRRDRLDEHLDIDDAEFVDLTDKQNPEFRYVI